MIVVKIKKSEAQVESRKKISEMSDRIKLNSKIMSLTT
jgi:hypothetical protein